MVTIRHTAAFHHGVDEYGRPLDPREREQLLAPFLPSEPADPSPRKARKKPIRQFAKESLHVLIFNMIHLVFSIYIKVRKTIRNVLGKILAILYYHHRTPDLIKRDVKNLSKVPQHLSVILDLQEHIQKGAALETLVNDVCECAAWSASAGIPRLSMYERSGVLKSSLPQLHRHISQTMSAYFGADSPNKPTISLRAPHMPSFSPPSTSPASGSPDPSRGPRSHLSILLLSASDGRRTLVDLTKTLTEMSQKSKLAPEDISPELVDAEISESVMDEPDLLILFGDSVILQGYPPWQVRLSEIFHVPDNRDVEYQVFLQALYKYANAQMRFGT